MEFQKKPKAFSLFFRTQFPFFIMTIHLYTFIFEKNNIIDYFLHLFIANVQIIIKNMIFNEKINKLKMFYLKISRPDLLQDQYFQSRVVTGYCFFSGLFHGFPDFSAEMFGQRGCYKPSDITVCVFYSFKKIFLQEIKREYFYKKSGIKYWHNK